MVEWRKLHVQELESKVHPRTGHEGPDRE